jgi:hypothetical protein
MIKKLSIFLVAMFIVAASGWVYLANKFEKIATEEILPKLQKKESLVSIDQDSIIIEKYKNFFVIEFRKNKTTTTTTTTTETFKINHLSVGLFIWHNDNEFKIGNKFYFHLHFIYFFHHINSKCK